MSGLQRVGEPGGSGGERLSAGDITGLAKVVASSYLRVGKWAAVTSLNAGRRVVDVALHPDHAAELVEDLKVAASAVSRALVGEAVEERMRAAAAQNTVIQIVSDAVDAVTPAANGQVHHRRHHPGSQPVDRDTLHEMGQELLRRSRDVWDDDTGHPAYIRIIEELHPDEGRILALLVRDGPQPTVDVRTGGAVGVVSSNLVAPGLNMIGARAGCRYGDRVPSYLHNLERLGLVSFSRETVRDPLEYQVVEAQPDVLAAVHSVRRAKIVRRSINLTPFGEDFCRDGLGLGEGDLLDHRPDHHPPDSEA